MKLVEILWMDSYTLPANEWQSRESLDAEVEPVIVATCGYLYRVTKNYIVVIGNRSSEPLFWGGIAIVKSSIVKARELK